MSKAKKSKKKKNSKSKSSKKNNNKKSSSSKKQQPKQPHSRPKSQASAKKPPAQSAKGSSSRNIKLVAGFGATLSVALLFGVAVSRDNNLQEIESSAQPTQPSGQQTIEVVPSGGRTPEATGYSLQGSSPQGQSAQGGLQTPQTVDQLQPNARIDDYENANLE